MLVIPFHPKRATSEVTVSMGDISPQPPVSGSVYILNARTRTLDRRNPEGVMTGETIAEWLFTPQRAGLTGSIFFQVVFVTGDPGVVSSLYVWV